MSHNTLASAQPPARRNQLDVLEDIAGGISELVDAGGGGAGGPDKELITLSYSANKAFTGASQGDLITGTQVVDLSGATPVVGDTVWQNQTTRLPLASAPLAADIDLAGGGGGATNAQLVAALATQTAAINAGPGVVVGNVAGNAADAGNPVKFGGVFNAARPTYTAGTRTDAQSDARGNLYVTLASAATAIDAANNANDAQATTLLALSSRGFQYHFNGTTWDRARGNTAGAFVQGSVADNTADAGNSVKVGGTFMASRPTYGNGSRVPLHQDSRGNLLTSLASGATPINAATTGADGVSTATTSLDVRGFNYAFNGANWDRMRGDVTGISANVLKQPLVARKIQVTAVSAEVQLTAATKRVSMYARGCDCRFRISAATGTAIATTDHFIAAGERLEFEMPNATPWIQAIAADLQSATGQLEITELS